MPGCQAVTAHTPYLHQSKCCYPVWIAAFSFPYVYADLLFLCDYHAFFVRLIYVLYTIYGRLMYEKALFTGRSVDARPLY